MRSPATAETKRRECSPFWKACRSAWARHSNGRPAAQTTCICANIHTPAHTYTNTNKKKHLHTHARIQIHTLVYLNEHIQVGVKSFGHSTYTIHTQTQTLASTLTQIQTQTQTHITTQIQNGTWFIHARIHIHIQDATYWDSRVLHWNCRVVKGNL